MKKILFVCAACMALMCTSCGFSRSATQNQNVTQTQVVLAKNNFKVLGTVSGECTQNYVFGIGGLSRKSMGESAMANMYKNAKLKNSQAVINVNIVYKDKVILIYNQSKAIATGTVIEFIDPAEE